MAVATAVMIDTIHGDVSNIPVSTPKVAGYITGTPDIRWTTADWDRFPHSGKVRINQDGSTDVSKAGIADVADYEPGAFTEAQVLEWVKLRKHSHLACAVYVAASNRSSLTSALREAGHTGVNLWIADWSLSEAEAIRLLSTSGAFPVVAVQWASPASNPNTRVPGSAKTLAEANVDLSITVASWFPKP